MSNAQSTFTIPPASEIADKHCVRIARGAKEIIGNVISALQEQGSARCFHPTADPLCRDYAIDMLRSAGYDVDVEPDTGAIAARLPLGELDKALARRR